MKSLGEVLMLLQGRGTLSMPEVARVAAHLDGQPVRPRVPWIVSALMAVGAWIAALFFVIFLFATRLVREDGSSLVVGLLLVGGAVVVFRAATSSVFLRQAALAMSGTGHSLMIAGVIMMKLGEDAPAVVLVLAAPALYYLVEDPLHRFLSVLAAVEAVAITIAASHPPDLQHLWIFAQVAGLLCIFLPSRKMPGSAGHVDLLVRLRPAGYALALALPLNLLMGSLPGLFEGHAFPSVIVLAGGLAIAARWATEGMPPRQWTCLYGAIALLAALSTPGLLGALLLLVLGFGSGRRPLTGLALGFLPAFLVLYYYNLDVTLAYKSWVLMGSGIVLLLARRGLAFFQASIPLEQAHEEVGA